jgi:UDP-N-acetyl-D-glucosamine dehydrogenase
MDRLPRSVKTVGIVGLGYVGLPLAMAFTEVGISVVGVDADKDRITALVSGESHVEGVPAERLQPQIAAEKLHLTQSYDALQEVEATVICLPTPLNEHREPDLSIVVAGAEAVAHNLRPGTLVVLESTTYPGTTREVLLPIFERNGYKMDKDFYLAYSPERVDPGNHTYTIENIPRVVGGITEESGRRAEELYNEITGQVHRVLNPEVAELSKLLENIFRGVNIALINEFAILCHSMKIDVWEVIAAARTKPFGFMPFYPGPGLGGHCIPIDPFYLSWRARAFDMSTDFIELAGRVNVSMPYYALSRITSALNTHKRSLNGSHILLLGMSYKPNVGDLRQSPSLKILKLLADSGAEVIYHDPHIPRLTDHGLKSVELSEEELSQADCVVIATDHDAVDLRLVVDSALQIVDLRDAVRSRLGELPANVDVL